MGKASDQAGATPINESAAEDVKALMFPLAADTAGPTVWSVS